MRFALFHAAVGLVLLHAGDMQGATLHGEIRDAASGELVAARLYVRSEAGEFFFARSASQAGSAVPYDKARDASRERHTALSAHPFAVDLPPGKYTVTVERGKEYLPHEETVVVEDESVRLRIALSRWVSMADFGWYSGDTHVHRALDELPTAMLADDVNVALPLTYWVTQAHTPPEQGDKNQPPVEAKLIEVSPHHVIWPLNTEYEIFTVGRRQHTLGAVFALGHRSVLPRGVPPVKPIAQQVHREEGLLDLDKHNWPWSMMLVPVMDVDLYELANNHHWRTEFFFRQFGEAVPQYMNLPRDPQGFDERAWTDFGFQNYYALLNCGFRLKPSAGTASGVHPVPLGWGRVYVHCPQGFSYEHWMDGLAKGRSFVTTGPLMVVEVNDQPLGTVFQQPASEEGQNYIVKYQVWNGQYPHEIEIVQEGRIVGSASTAGRRLPPSPELPAHPHSSGTHRVRVKDSTWLAVRCFETMPDGRRRFAHSAPFHIDVAGRPLRPRKEEVEYLSRRVQDEIERNAAVLTPEALAEYREALEKYQQLAKTLAGSTCW
jgi:hypothetical protein